MQDIFEELNEEQRKAAKHIDGPLLILAGAGSGKTLTITTRLAYLLSLGMLDSSILTLTFTNKAAKHMRFKALSKIKDHANPLLCTFHKFGLLFLRMHINRLNRKNDFLIADSNDVKKIIKSINNTKDFSNQALISFISKAKNDFLSPDDLRAENNKKDETKIKIYELYQSYLLQQNLVDFDDLLLLSLEILKADLSFAKEISRLYRYIMVDEYQDTNALQAKLLNMLCFDHDNICVVGDDDQSIYSFRGARIENILSFEKVYKNTTIIRLENNYRSLGNILKLANKLITHNNTRLGKRLICTKEEGEKPSFLSFNNAKEEASFIAKEIKKLILAGENPNEIAILFRINALSRALEEAFMKERINFALLSGLRFYEREEIKDIISYLRLIVNENDDLSLERIINKPARNIGLSSFSKLKERASFLNTSLFSSLENNIELIATKKGRLNAIKLVELIHELKLCSSLKELIAKLEASIKLKDFYAQRVDGEEKIANIEEFYSSFKEKARDFSSLLDLLNEISLLSSQDEDLNQASIYLMSIHAAKGLEFDNVFIIGLEEGLFPLYGDDIDIEEERRLCYVALTRAKKKIYLSKSAKRSLRGENNDLLASRFLKDLELDTTQEQKAEKAFKKGDLIKHKVFGMGRIKNIEKDRLCINFGGLERTILANFVEKI